MMITFEVITDALEENFDMYELAKVQYIEQYRA